MRFLASQRVLEAMLVPRVSRDKEILRRRHASCLLADKPLAAKGVFRVRAENR